MNTKKVYIRHGSQLITKSGSVDNEQQLSKCGRFGIKSTMFVNQGTRTAIIDSTIRLVPGARFSISVDSGEIDVSRYNITFPENDPSNTGDDKRLIVITGKIVKS